MDHQQRTLKRQQFRKQIRRHQLDTFFQQKRRQIKEADFLQQSNRISIQLQSNEKRLNFIQQAALELSGDPKPQWKHTIQQLQKAVLTFKGEIVKKLCLCLDRVYKECDLWGDVAAIFIDMLYCSHREQTHFVKSVMEEEIGLKLIDIAAQKELSIGLRLNYLMLMSKIIICDSRYRKDFIRDGAGSLLVQMGFQILAQQEINEKNLSKFMQCLHTFIDFGNANFSTSLINLIKTLISPLLQILFMDHITPFIISKCLVCLNIIMRTGKAYIISAIYSAHGMINKLLTLLCHQAKNIRLATIEIIGRISYSDDFNVIGIQLIAKGLYNAMYHSYQKLQSKSNKYFVQTSMTILSNTVCQLPQEIETIVFHPVFQIVINQMFSQVPSTQFSYVYCMHSMFQKAQYKHFEHLLKDYDTIKSYVHLLVNSNDKQVIGEVCSALILIIEVSSKTFNRSFSVVEHLESIYNITNTILHIQGKTKNKYISQHLDALLKQIQEYEYGPIEHI